MIFESHAHYDDEAFDTDREEILAQCQREGIEYIVNVSASLKTVKSTLSWRSGIRSCTRRWAFIRMRWAS